MSHRFHRLHRVLAIIFVMVLVLSILECTFADDVKSKIKNGKSEIQGIVSLSPNLTEIVFALGLGNKVVGVSSDSDWPVEAKQKPKMGTFWQPNTEAIIAAKPDLVVCESFLQHKEVAETLKRAGLRVVSLRVESIEELYNAITQIGSAASCSDKAEQLAAKIKSELDQIRAKASSAKKVEVLWAVQTEPMRVVGVKTFVNEIIDIGGRPKRYLANRRPIPIHRNRDNSDQRR